MCAFVCTRVYTYLHMCTSACTFIPPSQKENISCFESLELDGDDIGRTAGDARIASPSEDLYVYLRLLCTSEELSLQSALLSANEVRA